MGGGGKGINKLSNERRGGSPGAQRGTMEFGLAVMRKGTGRLLRKSNGPKQKQTFGGERWGEGMGEEHPEEKKAKYKVPLDRNQPMMAELMMVLLVMGGDCGQSGGQAEVGVQSAGVRGIFVG